MMAETRHVEFDEHMGAVEGDKPADDKQGNPSAPALDDQGLPLNRDKICEDVLGANNDGTEG
jgi:hypothetical protein